MGKTLIKDGKVLVIGNKILDIAIAAEPNYLCFTAVEATDIAFSIEGTLTTTPIIQYRINNGSWTSYTFGNTISLNIGDKCYWKGNNNSFSETYKNYIYFSSTGNVNASGNVMSLVDETCQSLVIPCDACFAGLFHGPRTEHQGCVKLLTAPELPATTLTEECYYRMFKGCTALATPPALPATTLADWSYQDMFLGCISLTTAPELPATTLAQGCYSQMFTDCYLLTSAPELPATTLFYKCYNGMFNSCPSLTTAPELPATTLAERCYSNMFNSCKSLTTAPELPATTLANSCYNGMFSGCTSLTLAPSLPATTLAEYCYNGMFNSCTSLTTAPELPATTLADGCYQRMFSGCTSLQVSDTQTTEAQYEWHIPTTGTFTNTTTYNQSNMFTNCLGTRSSDNITGAQGESHIYYTQNQPV